jgi:3-hydroxybutyryl-CoA dehydrogenase
MSVLQSDVPLIAIVGAGRMGRGIAVASALAGMRSRLIDLKQRSEQDHQALRDEAMHEVHSTIQLLADIGLVQAADVELICANVSFADQASLSDSFYDCGYVFEAVPETIDAKGSAFEIICQHVADDAVIASTTSTILSTDLQALVSNPERFINAHWLNPAFLVPLVELSPATATSKATIDRLKQLLQVMGKMPVVCKASPGYIVPRMQMLAMNEAARMVEEGVASEEDIDIASKYGFGFRFAILGMLEFIDWGGGDILYHAGQYMTEATGESRYAAPDIVNNNMKNNRIGLRTGQGFLNYDGLDVDAYKRRKLSAFVDMLKHMDATPARDGVYRGKRE